MKTVYALKEVCKWSLGEPHIEHRYVDITTVYTNTDGEQVTLSHTLELPTDEAVRLCNTMNTAPKPLPAVETNSSAIIASLFVRQWVERTCRVKRRKDGEPVVYDLHCPSIPFTEVWRRNQKWVLAWLASRERDTDTVQAAADLGWTLSFDCTAEPEVMFVPLFVTPDVSEHA